MTTAVMTYQDRHAAVKGWLVYDGIDRPLAAGGCRMQPGLNADHLAELASRMTLKQSVLGLNVDGAKCGLDYDPRAVDRAEALRGFLGFLRDELGTRFSMGSDMGTEWNELQAHARSVGVPSVKYAIARAQGLSDDEFFARMSRLDEPIGLLTLSQRRAGHAVAHAVVGAARVIGIERGVSCALQGFGNLGRSAALTLYEAGVRVVAVADEHGCLADPGGLDIPGMLASPLGTPVPQLSAPGLRLHPRDIFTVPADILALAACADAMSEKETADSRFGAVVVGANCGLSDDAEHALHARGVFVVPDFIGGIGGSASMEALFGPRYVPTPRQVLDMLARIMRELVDDIADTARRNGSRPREAALHLAATTSVDPAAPPYGHCRYLTRSIR